MVRDGKPKGFFYLDHTGLWTAGTDTYATPANVHDSIVYLGRLTASGNALVLTSVPLGWMPVMPPQALLKGWNSAVFSGSSAIAG
jgi:hypothetical protein